MPNQTIIHRKTAITRRNRKLSIVKPVFFFKKIMPIKPSLQETPERILQTKEKNKHGSQAIRKSNNVKTIVN